MPCSRAILLRVKFLVRFYMVTVALGCSETFCLKDAQGNGEGEACSASQTVLLAVSP